MPILGYLQFQRRGSHELLSIKVRAPDMDLPLSLVVPKDASVSQVIVSILHKLDGSSLTTRLDSSGFELRMVRRTAFQLKKPVPPGKTMIRLRIRFLAVGG